MFLTVFQGDEKAAREAGRQLNLFIDLTKLFYGVSVSELENDRNNDVRSFLEFNLRCWQQSKDTPLFKLNAIERLIINEQIKGELEKMLLHLMEQISAEPLLKEIPFQSMIFVNDMLICNHRRPNSPKIVHSDLILLTLMVKTYFCCLSDLEDKTLISSDSDYIASDEELDFCDMPYCVSLFRWLCWLYPLEDSRRSPANQLHLLSPGPPSKPKTRTELESVATRLRLLSTVKPGPEIHTIQIDHPVAFGGE